MSEQTKPVYIKNKARESAIKRTPEAIVPEHVRLGIKPVEYQSFEDDFRSSASAIKRRVVVNSELQEFKPPPVVNQPVVGNFDMSVFESEDPNQDIIADEVPDPPLRHRRFMVVEGAEPTNYGDLIISDPEPQIKHQLQQQTNIVVEEKFELGVGHFGIFMGNNFICACQDQEEAEQAVEIILSTDPPEEIIVVKRVDVKIGVNIIG